MSDIILVHPDYPWPLKYPPMGVAYLAAYLEKMGGYSVRIIDLAIEPMSLDELTDRIGEDIAQIAGISFMTCQAQEAYDISDAIKGKLPWVHTVGGGIHATTLPEEARPHFDFLVMGEGEKPLLELSDALIKEDIPEPEIRGVFGKPENGAAKYKRRFLEDLNALPFPAWDLLHLDRYKGLGKGLEGEDPFMVILGSRGCPNHCVFCASHIVHGKKFRCRSPQSIVDELTAFKSEYGIGQFDFADDTMTVFEDRILELCSLIRKKQLDIRWDCNARVNTVNMKMLRAMKAAGCVRINFGVESGDPEILKRAKKGFTIDQIKKAHQMARDAGLRIMSFFMLGLPGETAETIERTLDLFHALPTDYPGLTLATPYPGTPLFDLAKEKGWIDDRTWNRYTTTIAGEHFSPVMRTDGLDRDQLLDKYREVLEYFRERESESL
ncbi:MAG: radical SAM protein [Pseudomonadota bacterium]